MKPVNDNPMKKEIKVRIVFCMVFWLGMASGLLAQEDRARLAEVEKRLDILEQSGVPLGEAVTIALNGPIQELVAFLGETTELNISVDPSLNIPVSVAFTDVKARDIILHLCDTYNLDLQPTGNILHLVPYEPDQAPARPKVPDIQFDPGSGLLDMRLRQDTLELVAQRISELTGRNIVLSPLVRYSRVNAFVNGAPLERALRQLVVSNGLVLEEEPDYFLIREPDVDNAFGQEPPPGGAAPGNTGSGVAMSIRKVTNSQLNIRADNVPVLEVARAAGEELGADFVLLAGAEEGAGRTAGGGRAQAPVFSGKSVSVQLRNVSYEELLYFICKNSPYSFKARDGRFFIGEREAEDIRMTRVFQMQFRSARGVQNLIPARMLEGVQVDSLYELNSLVLSGSQKNIDEITHFLHSIDRPVPVVAIELTIVDVQSNQLDDYGIEAGVAQGGKEAGGTIIGGDGIDFTFSTGAINRLLEMLSRGGIINLGQVSPDFYLTLRALQETGVVEIKSTPRLSTLNSHSAVLSIGQKRYYQEQQVNFPGFDRPIPVQALVFREVEANLQVNINPVVSGDEEVTLNIAFEQSEFIGDPGPLAPPPQVSRRFDSMIRVRNGETIVLGGLERELDSKTKSGVPWISKVPVLGWIFGRHRRNKQKEKLLIFIKPVIVN